MQTFFHLNKKHLVLSAFGALYCGRLAPHRPLIFKPTTLGYCLKATTLKLGEDLGSAPSSLHKNPPL